MTVLTEIRDLLKKQTLNTKRVMDIDEVAAFTNLKAKTIYNLISKRMIPYSQPTGDRGKLFFDREKIEQWLLSKPAELESDIDKKVASYMIKTKK